MTYFTPPLTHSARFSWGIAVVLLFAVGACDENVAHGDGDGTGGVVSDGDGTGGVVGDGDGTGGVVGDGDGTGGVVGDGDGTGGVIGDGDGIGGVVGDGDGDTGCDCGSEESCVAGECVFWECDPYQDFCSGSEVRTCAADGLSSVVAETCSGGEYCDEASGTCKAGVCAPFLPACVTDRSWRVCNADGDGYEAGVTQCASTGESCEGGSCMAWVCEPDKDFCQGQDLKVCAANGLSSTVQEKCEDQACIESPESASCEGECAPGMSLCSENGRQTCDARGKWAVATACGGTHCDSGECAATPPSCEALAALCGPNENESCCTSPLVTGGTFYRGHDSVTLETSYPATISDFRLDKYEVTVGRFRKFVDAVVGGWRPSSGAGKHKHLNAGQGLSNSNTGGGYEPGWATAWNTDDDTYRMHSAKSDWDSSLSCNATYQTWTPVAGANESRPINCVNSYQAAAFCAWDGGFLPSEAEWNYAATGGSEQRYYPWSSPANSTIIDCNYAAYSACEGDALNAGTLSPEGDGRYGQSDLAGNVLEWTLDWYVTLYHTTCNDCANTTPASLQVLRGGGYTEITANLGSSYRQSFPPYFRNSSIGLRCARSK